MKKIGLFILAIGFTGMLAAQKPGADFDVQHYTFSLSVSDSSNQIKGSAAIEILFLKYSRQIQLDFASNNSTGKGMKVMKVTVNGKPVSFTHSKNLLIIDSYYEIAPLDRTTIVVTYEGIPADGLIIAKNKYGHRGFFSDNWPNRARNWLPCVDHPADKAAVDFIITAPSHYKVISNGIKVEEAEIDQTQKLTHYQETVPLATKILALGIAEFAIQQAGDVQAKEAEREKRLHWCGEETHSRPPVDGPCTGRAARSRARPRLL